MSMKPNEWTVVREYDTATQAAAALSILREAGIHAVIRNELMSGVYPTGIFPAQLAVCREDAARAEELLTALTERR